MKVAILVLAHTGTSILEKLVQKLPKESFRFFIHVDAKSNLDQFTKLAKVYDHCEVLDHREKVYWGGFSMIKAYLALLSKSKKVDEFDRFILGSDSDYLIKNYEQILTFFKNNKESEFISNPKPLEKFGAARYQRYHFMDFLPFNIEASKRQKSISIKVFAYIFHQVWTRIASRLLPKRKYYNNMTPYKGNCQICITRHCAEHILTFVKLNPGFMNFNRFVANPDESFFHTIIMNSDLKKNVYLNKASNEFGIYYVDWDSYNNGSSSDHVLRTNHYSKLKSSEALLARKFSMPDSKILIEKLEDDF